jgi:hypothetical protein
VHLIPSNASASSVTIIFVQSGAMIICPLTDLHTVVHFNFKPWITAAKSAIILAPPSSLEIA